MRRHFILWKFKPDTTAEQIAEAFAQLEAMQAAIPTIRRIQTGKNVAGRNGGFTHFLEVVFDDAAGHEAYSGHPVHLAVANQYTRPIFEEVLALDFDEPS